MPRLSKIGAAALAAFGWTGLSSVTVSYLQVAGGGAGGGAGGYVGGGGGAGGYLTGTTSLNPTLSYTVVVGAGGAGSTTALGASGSNSQFGTLTASVGGGGGGATSGTNGANGGSGGGAGYSGGTFGTGTAGQGNNGANGDGTGFGTGGGGGGASAAGTAGSGSTGGAGGAGSASSISGTSVTYAGGGAGAAGAGGTGGTGGAGGGGNGANGSVAAATRGTANLGGGGGAANASFTTSGSGGSGVVIISYVGAQQFGGGIVTTSGANTIHTFQTSGTLSPLSTLTVNNYLIVAGGAAGVGGGGGAGGMQTGSGVAIDTNSIYVVTVGAGGAGASPVSGRGASGGNSSFSAYATASVGGGGGGSGDGTTGANGGSGGGGGGGVTTTSGGTGTAGQGNNGGTGFLTGGRNPSGGGGGAGAVGGNAGGVGLSSFGGAGGDGAASSISGTSTTYAGGGGGAGDTSGAGGAGGGGSGTTSGVGGSGTANTGGGGGGVFNNFTTGSGGSGIVIISYAGATQLMAGGTVTITGGNVIHTFNSSGYLAPLTLVGNSLRFRASATAYLSRTPASASNQKTWTWSGWVKRGSLSVDSPLFNANTNSSVATQVRFTSTNIIRFYTYSAALSQSLFIDTAAVFRDPAAWYHVVAVHDTTQASTSNMLKIYVNGILQTVTTTGSLSQNADGVVNGATLHTIGSGLPTFSQYLDGYMTDINFIDGQALTPNSFGTFNSFGVWQPIVYGGSYGTNGFYLPFNAGTSATVQFTTNSASNYSNFGGTAWQFTGAFTIETYVNYQSASSGDNSAYIISDGTTYLGFNIDKSANLINVYLNGTTPAFTAPYTVSANTWAHLALVRSGSTVTMYVNGVARGSTTNSGTLGYSSPTINRNGGGATAQRVMSNLRICKSAVYTSNFTPSTTALTATSQGATNCELLTLQSNPPVDASTNAYSVTTTGTLSYATAYPFAWGIFNDQSPQGNNWTPNNISGYPDSTLDYMTDVPTLTSTTAANYAVWNPLLLFPNTTYQATMSNANMLMTRAGGGQGGAATTMAATTGKFYAEMPVTAVGGSVTKLGVMATNDPSSISAASEYALGDTSASVAYRSNGARLTGGTTTNSWGATYTTGDVIGVAFDADTGKIWFAKNGTFQASGDPAAGTNQAATLPTGVPFYFSAGGESGISIALNCGQQPFAYTPPSGFLPLNTFNL